MIGMINGLVSKVISTVSAPLDMRGSKKAKNTAKVGKCKKSTRCCKGKKCTST